MEIPMFIEVLLVFILLFAVFPDSFHFCWTDYSAHDYHL